MHGPLCAYLLGHGPVCSRSYFTGHRVPSFAARAIARSWCTGHCGLGPGERTGHCALGLGVEVVFEVFAHGRICAKSWFTGHFVLSLGGRALLL